MKDNDSPLCMPFGKYKGMAIEDLPSSYLRWLAENMEIEDIADTAQEELKWRDDYNAHFEE